VPGQMIVFGFDGVNRHTTWYTSPYPWSCSVHWMPGWWTSWRRSATTYGKR